MKYDAIVIGGGLAGLTSASLFSKRGLKVAVVEHSYMPGESCGSFRRKHVTFDQGAAMLESMTSSRHGAITGGPSIAIQASSNIASKKSFVSLKHR
jgi:phytoene dehydrogenase-like protein